MNYYIKGDAANADKIKAAFERNGIDTSANSNYGISNLFYFSCNGDVAVTQNGSIINIIKTHPDYQELELPKPHYDIKNFHAGMPVLVRETSLNAWQYVLFSHCYIGGDGLTRFNAGLVGFTQCIPFNNDTKCLLGTTNVPSEEYINW